MNIVNLTAIIPPELLDEASTTFTLDDLMNDTDVGDWLKETALKGTYNVSFAGHTRTEIRLPPMPFDVEIAMQISFEHNEDAVLFKLTWLES